MGQDTMIFEGKTLDDAVRKGLDALGLSRAEVMITMVEEGSGGFLGIGSRPYRVKVMPRPGGPIREPGEPRGREGGGRRGRSRPERDGRGREGRNRDGRGGREARGGRGAVADSGRGPRRGRPDRPDEARPAMGARSSADSGERGARRRRGRRGGQRGAPGRAEPHQERAPLAREASPPAVPAQSEARWRERRAAVETGGPNDRNAEPRDEQALTPAELASEGKRLTEELLSHMGFEATVTTKADEDRVDVAVSLEESEELLTGGKGEVRVALQHLLNLMLSRGRRSRYHLQLEINDFWQSREEELRRLAHKLAEEAVSSQSEVVTEYLNAQERRVVHMTLKEDPRVKTYALGTGLIKRVAVAPADFPEEARPEG